MDFSPALSVRSDFSDMDDDALDLYLSTCVPLSNLPTPPPVKKQSDPAPLPTPPFNASEIEPYSPKLQVYATHLANMVPRSVSSRTAEVAAISVTLRRAGLPDQVVAFAACILDALSTRFAGLWRESFDGSKPAPCDFYFGYDVWQRSTASPDLIVLSALALAHGFLDDHARSNSHWTKFDASGRFEARDVELAKKCILQDTDFGLFRISEEMVQRRLRDWDRACDLAHATTAMARKDSVTNALDGRRPRLSLSTGTCSSGVAIWVHGVQTPEPSP